MKIADENREELRQLYGMKMPVVSLMIAALVSLLLVQSCDATNAGAAGYLHKDLSEQMDALAVYQGAIGEDIRQGRAHESMWLVDGMDSVLQLVCERLNNHRNLRKPFEYYYARKLKQPISDLRSAIEKGDTAAAHQQYRLIVQRCNSCHNEHDVEERAHY